MVPRKTCAAAAILIAALTAGQAGADDKIKAHIYDSAKHTRIYFPSGADAFADEVVEYKVGKKKPPHLWETGEAALGPPNFKDHEGDRLARKPSFSGLGAAGSPTLRFVDNALVDGPGPDLYIFEPLENCTQVKVEVSRDGKAWIDLGPDLTTAAEIDIAGKGGKNAVYNFVRITDATSNVDPADQWPGADIDAVGALNSAAKISILDHSLCPSEAPAKKHQNSEVVEVKDNIPEEYKGIVERFSVEKPNKLIVEVYSDTHDPKEHHAGADEGKGDEVAGPAKETKNPQAKSRTDAVSAYLTGTGKIPSQRIDVDYFDNARSLARRDVVKEHERDNRFDFIFLPYDRDTVAGDKAGLKIDQASKLIDGKWDSEQGEVILIAHKDPASPKVLLQGEWHESPARKGLIQSGSYDPKTQLLTVSFYRTWSNIRGTADFKLSFDSARLKGSWKGETSGTGDWVLIRKN